MEFNLLTNPEEIGRKSWHTFVSDHPEGSVFQSVEMHDLFLVTPNYSPVVLAIKDKHREILALVLAVLIRDYRGLAGGFTTRVIVHDGPLIKTGITHPEKILSVMLEELIRQTGKKSLYIQFRNLHDMTRFEDIFYRHGFILKSHLNLVVPTSETHSVLLGISKSKIRQAHQSIQSGAQLLHASSETEVREFYRILKRTYRDKVRKPLASESMFIEFFKASQRGELGFILVVKYQGIVAGGMVCLLTPGKSLTEWYICGLDKKWRNVYPSVLVTYGAIQYAMEHQIPFFDFLGVGRPEKPYGVRDFKLRFGGNLVNYGRYQRINNRLLYPVAKAGLSLLATLKGI